jgi:hypothetical protein
LRAQTNGSKRQLVARADLAAESFSSENLSPAAARP